MKGFLVMSERMGFIVKSPVRFNRRAIVAAKRIDPALVADVDDYRQ